MGLQCSPTEEQQSPEAQGSPQRHQCEWGLWGRGKHVGQMEAGAKIQIASIKGLFNSRPNDDEFADQQVGQLGPGSDRDTRSPKEDFLSFGFIRKQVFNPGRCQCVQEKQRLRHVVGPQQDIL